MKSTITQLLVTLGVIFLILLVVGIYLIVADPYGLKPLIFGRDAPMQNESVSVGNGSSEINVGTSTEAGTATRSGTATGTGFELSSAQVEALVSLGIDPEAVPASISPEQEACFVDALGEAQVEEIKGGAVPSALEFVKAKSCI